MSKSYEERIKELENRGVKTGAFLSDWCITCVHSKRLFAEYHQGIGLSEGDRVLVAICETGCNGLPEFYQTEKKRLFSAEGLPLRYERELGTEEVEI